MIVHQNIRGLPSSFTNICKLSDTHRNIDVLTLSETHIYNEENTDGLYKIPGYKFINRHHGEGRGGGVGQGINKSLKAF